MPPTLPSIQRDFAPAVGVGSVPAAVAGSVVATEYGVGCVRQTLLTLTALSLTVTDALAYLGTLIYTFPEGRIGILGCTGTMTFTTTTAIASTINSTSAATWALGTATASNITLATTMINICPGTGQTVTTFVTSATINVAGTASPAALVTASTAQFDGTATPIGCYLNVAFPTNTDIDADGTMTVTGTALITWVHYGDL